MRKLRDRHNPRSYQRLLRRWVSVIKVAEVKNIKDVQSAVEDWESAVSKLESEYNETLNEPIKIAILLSMTPDSLQEKIYEIEKGTDEVKYVNAKEVVINIALRKEDSAVAQRGRAECFLGV